MNSTHPNNCNDCPVFKTSLFKDFNLEQINWLASKKKAHNLNKKDTLFSQGQNVEGIYCHLDGLAKVTQTNSAGDVQFTRLVFPGDTSGHRSLFIENKYKGTALVISNHLQACFISNSDILFLLSHNPSLAKNLIIKISAELNRTEDEVISVKKRNVRSRLAYLLYSLGNKYAEEINSSQRLIKYEISKKDISSLLMVANETIIRLMSEMKNEGLVSYEGKRILINDIDKIKTLSRIKTDE